MFYIDYLLLAHVQESVITEFIRKLDREYATHDPLTVTRGQLHEYLGQSMDFSYKEQCAMTQYDFIKKLWLELPEALKRPYKCTPAPENLFKISLNSPELSAQRKGQYHRITAKILWLSQRTRPDTQLATGFHCTRVKKPTKENWKKLRQLLGYIWKTRFLPLIIGMDDSGNVVIYVDGAHAVHSDGKGHSGLFVTMGTGAMINASKKLRVDTVSSTEPEVVSTGERFPKCTWFRYFRGAQGSALKEGILMQDNQSCILLQKNYPFFIPMERVVIIFMFGIFLW